MPRIDLTNGKVSSGPPPPVKVTPPGRRLSNWLMAYGDYTAESEAASEFHLWVGLGTIAGAVQRKVWMQAKYGQILANLYTILVGEPGTFKTTALLFGQKILKDVPGVHFSTKAGSPAALISQLAGLPSKEHQSLTAFAYELGTMLSNEPNAMIDLLTDLYDGHPDWDKQTIGRGLEKIPRPWLNLMGGTTQQWLGDYLPPTAVEGGFVSRTLFVHGEVGDPKHPFPEETPEYLRLRQLLLNDLTHISTLNGIMEFAPEAKEAYAEWYMDKKRRFPPLLDGRTKGYYARKHIHVLKVAMLLSMAERDDLILTVRDLETAFSLLKTIEPGMAQAFSSVGRNPIATDMERILSQIRGQEKMSYGAIVKANYHALDRRRIDEILSQLVSMGEVKLLPGGGYGIDT